MRRKKLIRIEDWVDGWADAWGASWRDCWDVGLVKDSLLKSST